MSPRRWFRLVLLTALVLPGLAAPEAVAWQPTPHPSHARAEPKDKMLPAITIAVRTLRMVYLFDRTNTRAPV